jgi:ferric-dicitrate binding protein FerR (iron transport regulator)
MHNLFIKYLHNQCSPEEVKELLGQFDFAENEIPLRRLINETLENTNADDGGSQWDAATDENFAGIKKRLGAEKDKVVPFFLRTWFRFAAAVVLLAAGSVVYLLIKDARLKPVDGQLANRSFNEKATEILFNSIATPRGEQYQLVLPDGSKVWLNAASSLRFPAKFTGCKRKVELSGEAYFEVAKNAAMPFILEVAGKCIV